MKFFQELGERVERSWASVNYDQKAFPAIAAEALASAPPSQHISYEDVIRWVHHSLTLPPQDCVKETFGDPPIAVYRASRFYIEVLFWLAPTTAIHEHSFCGAFNLLNGTSLEVQYGFEPQMRLSERLSLGRLARAKTTFLAAGDVVPILPAPQTIHSVFHLDKPSVSVVVRTYHSPDVGPQREFHLAGLAVDAEYLPDSMSKRLRTLSLLRAVGSDQFFPLASAFMEKADALSAYWFSRTFAHDLALEDLEAFLGASELSSARLQDALLGLARELRRERALLELSSASADADRRYFLALLLSVRDREEILRLLARRFPLANASEVLGEFGSTLDVGGGGQSLWDDSSRAVLRHVLRGGTGQTFLDEFALRNTEAAVRAAAPGVEQLVSAIKTSALFGTLCP